jgi:hypothetical protein
VTVPWMEVRYCADALAAKIAEAKPKVRREKWMGREKRRVERLPEGRLKRRGIRILLVDCLFSTNCSRAEPRPVQGPLRREAAGVGRNGVRCLQPEGRWDESGRLDSQSDRLRQLTDLLKNGVPDLS